MTDHTESGPLGPRPAPRIEPHLPLLRRYARALTGSQESGDAYVQAVIDAVRHDAGVVTDAAHVRIGLYAALHSIWTAIALGADDRDPAADRQARVRAGRLPSPSRQALLLTAVEGFSVEEAATILDVTRDRALELLERATVHLNRQLAARVLIIEDEPVIAMDLHAILRDLGHDVIGVADTRDKATALALAERPDLVLADVQLADGSSGVDAARQIVAACPTPVIFITAYPDRLLTGARIEPAFLIEKPFRVETVQALVTQALFFRATPPHAA